MSLSALLDSIPATPVATAASPHLRVRYQEVLGKVHANLPSKSSTVTNSFLKAWHKSKQQRRKANFVSNVSAPGKVSLKLSRTFQFGSSLHPSGFAETARSLTMSPSQSTRQLHGRRAMAAVSSRLPYC